MSATAVILTSEQCGHCRTMRGSGRLLSRNEIKSGNLRPTIPGNYHYDAIFMKKLITAESDIPKVRVININFKTFDVSKGVTDISIFTLESDNTTVKQTMLIEKDGKTHMNMYAVGESGKVLLNSNVDKSWSDITSEYLPVNLGMYTLFFPSMIVFETKTWNEGVVNKKPLYGFLNGFETKESEPYGAIPAGQPKTLEWSKFLKQFFDGTKKLTGAPVNAPVVAPQPVVEKI